VQTQDLNELNKLPENVKEKFKKAVVDVVVASPGTFFVIGEHSVLYGQPALCMAFPGYVYVGVKKSHKNSVELYKCNPNNDKLEEENTKNLKDIENRIFQALHNMEYGGNYEITIVSDVPPACGLNSSGALSAALSTAIHLLNEKITIKDVDNWQKIDKLGSLRTNEKFGMVFKLAWEIDNRIQKYENDNRNGTFLWSSGVGPFASLVGSPKGDPIMYIRKKGGDSYFGVYLSDLAVKKFGSENRWNDKFLKYLFAVIYSGNKSMTGQVFGKQQRITEEIYQPVSEFVSFVGKFDLDPDMLSPPLKSVIDGRYNETPESYMDRKAYETLGGYSMIAISDLITDKPRHIKNMMNIYQIILHGWRLSSREIDEICHEFHKKGFGAKLTGSGQGGCVVIFSHESSRHAEIEKTLKRIKENTENDRLQTGAKFLFRSWKHKERSIKGTGTVYVDKYFKTAHILDNKKCKKEVFVGIIPTEIPTKFDKDSETYKFTDEARSKQRGIIGIVESGLKSLRDIQKTADIIVLPEYSLPPDKEGNEIAKQLKKIAEENECIFIGGTYLRDGYAICPIITPQKTYYQYKLNAAKGEGIKEGSMIHVFKSGALGNFCVLICYDFTDDKILNGLFDFARHEKKCFTVFVPSLNPDIPRFNDTAKRYMRKMCAEVVIANSWTSEGKRLGEEGPVCSPYKGDKIFSQPIFENENIILYKLIHNPDEISKAWSKESGIYRSVDAHSSLTE
jgi:mevalonate kinase